MRGSLAKAALKKSPNPDSYTSGIPLNQEGGRGRADLHNSPNTLLAFFLFTLCKLPQNK